MIFEGLPGLAMPLLCSTVTKDSHFITKETIDSQPKLADDGYIKRQPAA